MAHLAVSPLKLEARRVQDGVFTLIYAVIGILTLAIIGYSSATGHDSLATIVNECTNLTTSAESTDDFVPGLIHSLPYLALTLVLSVLVGVIWLALLKAFAKPVVYATLLSQGLIMIAVGVYLYTSVPLSSDCEATTGDCTGDVGPLVFIVLGALYLLFVCCAHARIALTARLIEQSVLVVRTHPGLFVVSAAFLLLKVAVVAVGVLALVLLAASQLSITKTSPNECSFDWKVTGLDEAMYAVVIIFLYWSVQLCLCLRFYVVSLTTGIWYYSHESLAAQDGALSAKEYTRAPISTAVRHALTKGFGTVALASMIMQLCEWLKAMAQRGGRGSGLVGLLIACCASCILNFIEFLTRFALTFAALTGQSFCTSGRTFLDTSKRHGFIKVLAVDYFASITLNMGALVFALLIGALTAGIVAATHTNANALLAIGVAAWAVAAVVLVYIGALLLNVVDASYACAVLDIDHRMRTGAFHRPAMAEAVFAKVKPELVVQQPGGEAAHAVPVGLPA